MASPTVRTIATDALTELGIYQPGETLTAADANLCLLRIQNQLDAWQANALTFVRQLRTVFVLPSGSTSVSVGIGQTVNITRPVTINACNFIIPSVVPSVEVPIGIMDEDAFAALSIKQLSSALPIQCFYEQDITGSTGTLTFWPQVSQNVSIALYTPQAIDVPATLDTVLTGPPGYAEAFMYNLADRLQKPFGQPPDPALAQKAARAFETITAPNVRPGVMGVDPAIVPGLGAGYNVLSDQITAGSVR